jgi:predicted transcriptional regulator
LNGIDACGRWYYPRGMATVTCKIPAPLDALLEEAAERNRMPKSEIIRQALLAFVPGLVKRKTKARSANERWKSVRGIVQSGVSDLATNPKYMNDFG